MYSERVLAELKKKNISVGDRIRIISGDSEFDGLLMPRPLSGDAEIIVIKLDNGYNTGLRADSVELIAKADPKSQAKSEPGQETKRGAKHETKTKTAPDETASDEIESRSEKQAAKHGISILGCGGTIASKIEYKTGAVYPSITPKELRQAFPSLEKWNIRSSQIFSLFSEDMNAHHWRLLADAIEEELKSGSTGVVVMHGTDTMTYTSAALSYMFQNLSAPIIFVGSQRSSDRPSSENEMNLLNSVFSATQDIGEVGVCMHASTNDDICHLHRGTRVRKMHSSRRDAFRSINSKPLAIVDYLTNRFEAISPFKSRQKKGSMVVKKEINDNVAIIYAHPGLKPDLISKLDSYDGVVLVGTGLGHVSTNPFGDNTVKSVLKPIQDLIASGIPVVMSSQCISGRVCMRVYSTGRLLMDSGVIGDGADWTPEAAYTKLCWVLGQIGGRSSGKDMKKVEQLMMTDLAGEISDRSVLDGRDDMDSG